MNENQTKSLAELAKERIAQKKAEKAAKSTEKEKNKSEKPTDIKKQPEEKLQFSEDLDKKVDLVINLLKKFEETGSLEMISGTEKESGVKSIRFLGYLASELKISGYSKMSRETLFLKIGLKMIELSNLVQDPVEKLKI